MPETDIAIEGQRAAPADAEFSSYAEFYQNSAYEAFPQTHRTGGSFGLQVFDVEQPAIDLIDAKCPDIVFALVRACSAPCLVDLGEGARRYASTDSGMMMTYPADCEARTMVAAAHRLTMMAIPFDAVAHLLDRAGVRTDPFSRHYGHLQRQPAATALIDRIWEAAGASDAASGLYLDGLVLQFLAVLSGEAASPFDPLGSAVPEDRRIARVIDYIETHLGDGLTVASLASVACLSPPHFSRTFKATLGESVWTYVQRRRAERAMSLLTGSSCTLSDAAAACGYASLSHMTRAVKARFGAPPSELRRGRNR